MGSGSSLFKGISKDLREEGTDQEGGATPPHPKKLLWPGGPDRGVAQLNLGRGWQGPMFQGELRKGPPMARQGSGRRWVWQVGFAPARRQSPPSLHLSSFIYSFRTNSLFVPCAKCGWRVRERGTQGVCSLAAGS